MSDKKTCSGRVEAIYSEKRLDAALAAIFPDYALRARRRLWEWCDVRVDGVPRQPSYKVRTGQEMAVTPKNHPGIAPMSEPQPDLKQEKAVETAAEPAAPGSRELETLIAESLGDELPPQLASLLQDADALLAADLDRLPAPDLLELEDLSKARATYDEKLLEFLRHYRPAIVAANDSFVAFTKPAGIASAALAGGESGSLEEVIAEAWPEIWESYAPEKPCPERPVLCNRLDGGTSGLLLAAFSIQAGELFREYERAGKARKKYLALVHGAAPEHMLMNKALDTYRRKTTLVLPHPNRDFTRHSKSILLQTFNSPKPANTAQGEDAMPEPGRDPLNVKPVEAAGLLYLAGLTGALSLLEVTIQRGARHQIRAHLAEAGFPIVGDAAYGLESTSRAGRMFLHHFEISLPGFRARWMPDWDLPIKVI
ncbi:MAG: hypothetical protein LBM64_08600 [Deltaproteobacteria bacterium]|jgi:23S rRNA-/tRNA-specific pseudouridylate synthase|nr:hypothetical protein [Deltaproteobacteria bacterium]